MGFSKFTLIISAILLLGACGVSSKDSPEGSENTFETGGATEGVASEKVNVLETVPDGAAPETCLDPNDCKPDSVAEPTPQSELGLSAQRPYGAILVGNQVLKCGRGISVPTFTVYPNDVSLSGKIFRDENRALPENPQILAINVGTQVLDAVPCSWSDYWDANGRALLGGKPLIPMTLQNDAIFRGELPVQEGDLLILIMTEFTGRPLASELNWRDVMPYLQDGYWLGVIKVHISETPKVAAPIVNPTTPSAGIQAQPESAVVAPEEQASE